MTLRSLAILLISVVAAGCGDDGSGLMTEPPDPPEVLLGERLFLETRFAQYFYASSRDINQALPQGDPVMNVTTTIGGALPGPFAGQSMNCRACHLVDEQEPYRLVRTYTDLGRRSPIPEREDGRTLTPRNSPSLVNATAPRSGPLLLHFDGEFGTAEELVAGTLTGRNFGWLADEATIARAHIARVIREDDGLGMLAAEFGALSYREVFLGSEQVPPAMLIREELRLDVETADDEAVMSAVSTLISEYVRSLTFTQSKVGEFDASPYDRFLRKNDLPRRPAADESDVEYSRRLAQLLNRGDLRSVDLYDGSFTLHAQEFRFGALEQRGLEIFLNETPRDGLPAGNCVSCHPAPHFTDFSFHNTGISQAEYDSIHGGGAFAALLIPGLEERNAAPEIYLPPSPIHPRALGVFADVPSAASPGRTDLGLWNVFANPAVPNPQAALTGLLCAEAPERGVSCRPSELLETAVAAFKTPGLRDLGQSAPYFHTGQVDSLEDVVDFYVSAAAQARAGVLRNADPAIRRIEISTHDREALAAFLRSLNEDYE